ncbi:DUF3833 domain-containing protein [Rhodobaculum claviforme]|uniref:DUF3833 domain-containing protein n=1 Tax=Rhodobaculum claviforme TaxID=1549854 RepID=A0A934TKW3_9RHOB|nr:DUF3833 domain-containing protein [Rhodobaculum claviforme]MBK5927429.1 hypothetical protein [Rhodobaculum claviforme]
MDTTLYILLGAVLLLGGALVAGRLVGFRAQRPADYAGQGPQFDLREHLTGPILCEGVIYGPLGRVSSRFVADMEASWDGDTGTMTEHFRYDSGATQTRQWQLTLTDGGGIKATAADVEGVGEGWVSGPTVLLRYRIRLPENAGGHVLDTTDWMYLCDNGTVINRSQFRKFGIKVAELVATMRRKD